MSLSLIEWAFFVTVTAENAAIASLRRYETSALCAFIKWHTRNMKTITVYSTPMCGFCKMLKAFLQLQSIPYTDRDVAVDNKALEEMQELVPGNMSVPVIVFNKGQSDQTIQLGYNQEKVESELGI